MDPIDWLTALYTATIPVGGGQELLLREVVGNAFGLASALGGMLRRVWAWPVGIIGNALLLTVFLGTVLDPAHELPALLGQAGRQVMFIAVAIYGWVRWRRARGSDGQIVPRWASWRQRTGLVLVLVVGTVAITPLFRALGSFEPVWADAWTFVGSLLATYGMAKGWTEFWLVWIAVDLVGVPLLLSAGYWATALMYAFYGVFTLVGFIVWSRARRKPAVETLLPDPRIGPPQD
ncbi:nicotinamide riboside transporter PnuC [Agrococcus baldri]|uniref:Membrane protein n=1 Tax=Agrococcus baldri TaxID=153730 RepID=A0AA87USW9_9MICO|nr:nicotinamide riboside transporter PnuC [Agrococcus baldri]GEK81268.1 membrane protein [Agrococcus baldri]